MEALQGTWIGGLLDDTRTQIYGWTDLSLTFGTAGHDNLPMGFNYRDNDFSLQQNWLRIDRSVVASGSTEPTFGYRSDWILPGTDYRFTIARGLFSGQLTADRGQPDIYGIDPVQFYGEAYFPTVAEGLDLKVGRFFGQYGVEAIDAPSNALFSHAYTFLDNPFTQTGFITTTQLTKEWSFQAGGALGQDAFFAPGAPPEFLGDIKWARPDNRDSITLSVILDSGRFNPRHDLSNANLVDLVITHKVGGQLSYSFESLGGQEDNVPDVGSAFWLGLVNYLTCDFTAQVSGTLRLEFFDDAEGVRTGTKGLYTDFTAGLSFRPYKWMIVRPELRVDDNDESRPFEGQHYLFTAASDLILRW